MITNNLLTKILAIIPIYLISLILSVSAKQILTIYTYSPFITDWGRGHGQIIKYYFEKKYNCELKLVSINNGITGLNRIKMEGKNSKADIILGLDNNLIDLATKTGLFSEININLTKLKLPIKWKNNMFVPYDYGYLAFIYDKRKIIEAPKSFDELLNSNKPWKIIYQDPRTSTLGLGLLLWIHTIYGQNSTDAWQKLAPKTITITKSWNESYGLFLKGECDFMLSYSSSPGLNLLNDKTHNFCTAALFSEGHYLQIEVAAQLVSSKNPELAKKFLQFLISPYVQKILPITNWMYPVIDIPLPTVYQQILVPQKSFQLDAKAITNNRKKWIYAWQKAIINR